MNECKMVDFTWEAIKACNDKPSCDLTNNPASIIGDPCRGVQKYTKYHIKCVPDKRPKSKFKGSSVFLHRGSKDKLLAIAAFLVKMDVNLSNLIFSKFSYLKQLKILSCFS